MNRLQGLRYGILICLLLITSACEKDDEILPMPPPEQQATPPAHDEKETKKEQEGEQKDAQNKNSSLDFHSELYQYGKFKKGAPITKDS
jgi:hypothetical protein